MTIKKLAGKVAVLIGGWRGIAAVLVKHLAADGADVASVFVTNGGCAGVQQVLRPHSRKPHPTKVQLTPDSPERGNRDISSSTKASAAAIHQPSTSNQQLPLPPPMS